MRRAREGMSLLTVLLLVAALSATAVLILDDVRFSLRRAANLAETGQARWLALGAEAAARARLEALGRAGPGRTPLEPEWNGQAVETPVEAGRLRAVVRDGQNCFNLNSVVFGQGEDLIARPEGRAQLMALGRALGIGEMRLRAVTDGLTDWLDADAEPHAAGAEDVAYAGRARPYRTSGVLLAEPSELRVIAGMDAETYGRLRPFVCALPTTEMSPVNPNTLTPEQAPLLVMLADGRLSAEGARAVISARPRGGWPDLSAFWGQAALAPVSPVDQLTLRTRYFDLRVDVEYGEARLTRTALIRLEPDGRARTVIQRWSLAE